MRVARSRTVGITLRAAATWMCPAANSPLTRSSTWVLQDTAPTASTRLPTLSAPHLHQHQPQPQFLRQQEAPRTAESPPWPASPRPRVRPQGPSAPPPCPSSRRPAGPPSSCSATNSGLTVPGSPSPSWSRPGTSTRTATKSWRLGSTVLSKVSSARAAETTPGPRRSSLGKMTTRWFPTNRKNTTGNIQSRTCKSVRTSPTNSGPVPVRRKKPTIRCQIKQL